jgi:hypothetical protein
MTKNFFALSLIACALGSAGTAVQADEVAMPSSAPASATPMPVSLPKRGETMGAVIKQFGEPQTRHAAVGGSSPKRPPITRWDYDSFSVFFEKDRVVDAVVPGHPPHVDHVNQLESPSQ